MAGELDAGSRQLLEIIKALSRGVPVMILDEPTAALNNAEKRNLFGHVKALKSQGVSFVYISHHLDEVFEVADTVTILRDGQVVKAREPVSNLDVETIANLMMGEKTERSVREDHTKAEGQVLLKAQGICVKGFPDSSIDFQLAPGEIVALGRTRWQRQGSLALALAGQEKISAGKVTSERATNFPDIGFVPNDRHVSGYIGLLGVRENVSAGGLDHFVRASRLHQFQTRRIACWKARGADQCDHFLPRKARQPIERRQSAESGFCPFPVPRPGCDRSL